MNIAEASEKDIEDQARDMAALSGKDWDKLTDEEKQVYRVEASFTFIWLC